MDQAALQAIIAQAVQQATANLQDQINAAQAAADQARNDLNIAQNQIARLQTAQQPQQQHRAQTVQFAYTPGTTGQPEDLIDYQTTQGAKIQKAAVEKLDVEHDLDTENLHDFLEALRSRSIAQGWIRTLLTIPMNGTNLNFLDNYGVITKEAVRTFVLTYMFQDTRAAQDSHNLYMCLEASLHKEARATLYAESENYTVQRSDVPNALPGGHIEERRRDGVLFLWMIVNRTTAKTNATISTIVRQLNHLTDVMSEHNSDVNAFNTHVRKLTNSYYANKREQFDSEVLLQNLFDAYMTCKDNDFVSYMKRKKQDHIDQTASLTTELLMNVALKQYQTLVQEHVWGTDSNDHQQIMNLTAQVSNLRKKVQVREDKSLKVDGKSDSKANVDSKPKTHLSPDEYRKKRYENAPKWMKAKPQNISDTKKRGQVEYRWCTYHNLWQRHSPVDCYLNPVNKGKQSTKKKMLDKDKTKSKSNVQTDSKLSMVATSQTTVETEFDLDDY
jgi:hypothetical protein